MVMPSHYASLDFRDTWSCASIRLAVLVSSLFNMGSCHVFRLKYIPRDLQGFEIEVNTALLVCTVN